MIIKRKVLIRESICYTGLFPRKIKAHLKTVKINTSKNKARGYNYR